MIRVRQIKIDAAKVNDEIIKKEAASKLRINSNEIKSLNIIKQSLDARNKDKVLFVYEVNVEVDNEQSILNKFKNNNDIFLSPSFDYKYEACGNKEVKGRIVVVGSGPAGLFAAYVLAENGYKPLVIERGKKVEDRVKDVEDFWKTGKLNINSNVQFGEGGAGTFSDGKLNTLIKDDNNRFHKVFNTFVKFGASPEILYSYKPHIGTDVLQVVVKNMREDIISMGGEFRYESCLTNINVENGEVINIEINNNEIIDTNAVILAIGHSARDTFKMLTSLDLDIESKPFAVGYRVQHTQDMINLSQHGEKYKDILTNATYKLTNKASNGHGVYSFCMCPGGYVVNSSSEKEQTCINGMSYSDRGSKNANSAIIITVTPNDFGPNLLDGMKFQKQIEHLAYIFGEGLIPTQRLEDFINNKETTSLGTVEPIFKGNYKLTNLRNILPEELNEAFIESMHAFGKKIKGFDNPDTLVSAVEARTSSPIRIKRDDNLESTIKGLFPCGEGAGYAGGITSAAIDGLKVAEIIGKTYKQM